MATDRHGSHKCFDLMRLGLTNSSKLNVHVNYKNKWCIIIYYAIHTLYILLYFTMTAHALALKKEGNFLWVITAIYHV